MNDVYGHRAGDAVLAATAQRITAALEEGEEAGRWGGEEFVILVRNARDSASLGPCRRSHPPPHHRDAHQRGGCTADDPLVRRARRS